MAVTSQGATYSGLSSDTKPTSNLTLGNLFVETDTNRIFIWNGSTWITSGSPNAYAFFLS